MSNMGTGVSKFDLETVNGTSIIVTKWPPKNYTPSANFITAGCIGTVEGHLFGSAEVLFQVNFGNCVMFMSEEYMEPMPVNPKTDGAIEAEQTQYRTERAQVNMTVEDIGRCLVDISLIQQQGVREDNAAKRGGIAAGLERAAYRIKFGTMEGFEFSTAAPPEKVTTQEEWALPPRQAVAEDKPKLIEDDGPSLPPIAKAAWPMPRQVPLEYTLGVIKSHAMDHRVDIDEMIQKAGLRIVRAECRNLTVNEAIRLYHNHVGAPYFIDLLESVRKSVCAFILCGENAIFRWRELMGATSPIAAAPDTVRYRYGNHEPGMTHENAVHGSDSGVAATREIDLLFPEFRGIGLEAKSSVNLSQ